MYSKQMKKVPFILYKYLLKIAKDILNCYM